MKSYIRNFGPTYVMYAKPHCKRTTFLFIALINKIWIWIFTIWLLHSFSFHAKIRLQIQWFNFKGSFCHCIFLFSNGLSQGSDFNSRLDEINTFIDIHYYQEDGQERPNMIFSVIGDSYNIVPKIWPKSRLQDSLTNAARAAGSMRIKINIILVINSNRDRYFFFFSTYNWFQLPNIEKVT